MLWSILHLQRRHPSQHSIGDERKLRRRKECIKNCRRIERAGMSGDVGTERPWRCKKPLRVQSEWECIMTVVMCAFKLWAYLYFASQIALIISPPTRGRQQQQHGIRDQQEQEGDLISYVWGSFKSLETWTRLYKCKALPARGISKMELDMESELLRKTTEWCFRTQWGFSPMSPFPYPGFCILLCLPRLLSVMVFL